MVSLFCSISKTLCDKVVRLDEYIVCWLQAQPIANQPVGSEFNLYASSNCNVPYPFFPSKNPLCSCTLWRADVSTAYSAGQCIHDCLCKLAALESLLVSHISRNRKLLQFGPLAHQSKVKPFNVCNLINIWGQLLTQNSHLKATVKLCVKKGNSVCSA